MTGRDWRSLFLKLPKSRNKSPQTLSPYSGEQLSHLVSINSQEPTAKGEPIPRLGSGMGFTETTASEQQDQWKMAFFSKKHKPSEEMGHKGNDLYSSLKNFIGQLSAEDGC